MCGENSFITPEATDSENCKIGHRNGIDLTFLRCCDWTCNAPFVKALFLLLFLPLYRLHVIELQNVSDRSYCWMGMKLNDRDFVTMDSFENVKVIFKLCTILKMYYFLETAFYLQNVTNLFHKVDLNKSQGRLANSRGCL